MYLSSSTTSVVDFVVVALPLVASYGLSKRLEPVRGCRSVTKKDMKWNDATPEMKVDPENYEVYVDGDSADIAPAQRLPLARAYNLEIRRIIVVTFICGIFFLVAVLRSLVRTGSRTELNRQNRF
jgi:hypothetical protein